ncbi:MAG TPA: iron-containing alcohol dehydrogenase [Polyangia bacterium]|nr:iron-containing alcohol dehydrogenase [Polyangia bacterium]
MSAFELATAGRVAFGAGAQHLVAAAVASAVAGADARRVLLVTGASTARAAALLADLMAAGLEVVTFPIGGEPTLDLARAGATTARGAAVGAVVAVGGGSALDGGKAIAALAANDGDALEYLEVVGAGRALERPSLPFFAVPTTAGTGSEVTRNAVLSVPEARVKASLRSAFMLPRLAAVDPELLGALPPAVVASSGLDALSQVIEPFLSLRANPLTDALARDGIGRSARALRRAYAGELAGDAALREDLALASLTGGLCLANAGLGAVHGFAAPAGGMFGAPHGAVCAALLPHVLAVNLRALRARAPEHPALPRFRELAALLTGAPAADVAPEDGVAFVAALARDLGVPGLASHGMRAADVPALVEKAKQASSMKGNPLPLTDAELTEIAQRAL